MKKTSLLYAVSLGALLFTTSNTDSLANGAVIAPAPVATSGCGSCTSGGASYTGFYAGAQVGVGMTRNYNKWTTIDLGTGEVTRGSAPHSMKGFMGGIHLGYGYQFGNNIYAGVEALANLIDNQGSERAGNGSFLLERRYNSFGVAPRLGYVWNATMLYLRFGVESTRWKHEQIAGAINSKAKSDKRLIGFVPGVGMSHLLGEHLIIGIEGTVGFYKKSRINSFPSAVGEIESDTFTNQSFDITARLSYKF